MPRYNVLYRSPDTQGVIRAVKEGPSEGIVRKDLTAQGLTVLLIQADNRSSWLEKISDLSKKCLQLPRFGVKTDELALLCEIFKALYTSGVQMLQIVELTIEETPNPWLRKKLAIVLEHLKIGDSLADSMSDVRCKKAFPPLMVETIRTGEANGRLDDALDRLTRTFKRVADTKRETKSALMYPAFAILVFIGVCTILAIMIPDALNDFIGPKRVAEFRPKMPASIRLLFTLRDHPVYLFFPPAFLASLIFLWIWGMKHRATRHMLTWVQRKTWLIGTLLEQFALVRFLEILTANHESGIAIGESLRLVRNSVDEAFIEESVERIREDLLRNGTSLGDAMNRDQERRVFPGLVRQMIRAGEASGKFSEMLYPIMAFYEEQSKAQLKRMLDMITPTMIVLIGVLVGPVVLGVYKTIVLMTDEMYG